ncbi:hypothetical protein bcCo53_001262 (plasmid) [Borrelia coriaceae]|uniref:Uncharacterized protein n=1 Tax=Borrelia coriaceae ATCC 43381 TaxID=1408429 RepID=W5SWF4_9SPIR|nr:hypothetical protein [Borrelia coriaceae]AHH11217.1 hypothetical protein BCO_0900052 [Borrelia coriaceae ATCC 43381]UPA17093.1 hypothetical protein bcCo53_001262 [Borrelia coriaceae]
MADRLEQMIKTIRGVLSCQDKILRDINSLKNKEWQKNLRYRLDSKVYDYVDIM